MKIKSKIRIAIIVLMFSLSFYGTSDAGLFGKYGNLKATMGYNYVMQEPEVILDCNYSLKSECTRADFR